MIRCRRMGVLYFIGFVLTGLVSLFGVGSCCRYGFGVRYFFFVRILWLF